MKYYETCKLVVGVPTNRSFDESIIRKDLDDELPGIQVEFRSSNGAVLEVVNTFVPDNHPVATAAEQNPTTKKWESAGAQIVYGTAADVLNKITLRTPRKRQDVQPSLSGPNG